MRTAVVIIAAGSNVPATPATARPTSNIAATANRPILAHFAIAAFPGLLR